MPTAISGSTSSNAPYVAQQAVPQSQPTAAAASKPAALQPDTVKLSPSAQAQQLEQQGQSLQQIATDLSLPVAIVSGYLGIASVIVASTPAPAQIPAENTSPNPPTAA